MGGLWESGGSSATEGYFPDRGHAVLPEHQGEGLGAMVMSALMSWLRDNAPTDAYVQLIAEEGAVRFYEGYGFRVRTPEGSGMSFMML
jgi:GNAT superfamily N-acetyltransferase